MITTLKIQDSIILENLERRFQSKTASVINLVDKACYLLSLISVDNSSSNLLDSKKGYVPLCSSILNRVLRTVDKKVILEALMDPNDPIIESDHSWRNSLKREGRCKGYRLTSKYRTGHNKEVEIRKRFSKKLTSLMEKSVSAQHKEFEERLNPLISQFKTNRLTLNPRI